MGQIIRSISTAVAAVACLAVAGIARADAGWFESGDTLLRLDMQLLNDAEVIRLPVNQWPMPRAAVRYAMDNSKEHFATNQAVIAALERVRTRLKIRRSITFGASVSGGEPAIWREFGTAARERGELGGTVSGESEHFAAKLSVQAVADPADERELRGDGSHATLQAGNWLLSAHTLDRWWGPAHDGNLILSNNARPIPTLTLERATARPFDNRWFSWLGPWRFSLGFGRMENSRADIDAPLFMAWRVVAMPFRKMELGFSRTAQFCGKQLECTLDTFGNLLAGNDNVGIDATPENEPGNQMAGFDLRWNSPIGNLPYAVYSQMIGEDESSYLPAKYLAQFGAETWKPLSDGGVVLVFAEYASTTCSANTSRGPYYNCAYNQGRFNVEGYRFHGRVIGFPSDRDAENYSVGVKFTRANGDLWSATARRSRFNRDDFDDVRNSVSSVPADYHALDLGWKGILLGQSVTVELGVERLAPVTGDAEIDPHGFVVWRHEFN